jgi:hypothetical protein
MKCLLTASVFYSEAQYLQSVMKKLKWKLGRRKWQLKMAAWQREKRKYGSYRKKSEKKAAAEENSKMSCGGVA